MPLLMPLKILGAPKRIIDAFQAILQPMVESTGMYETGKVGFLPSPQKLFQQLQAVAAGFEKASQILAGNYPDPEEPGEPPVITAPDTTTEIIDAMEDRDEELNGVPASSARVAAAAQVPAAGPDDAAGESDIDELSVAGEPEESTEAEAPSAPIRRIPLTSPRSAKVAPRTAGTSSP
jgi:hypothetical protein